MKRSIVYILPILLMTILVSGCTGDSAGVTGDAVLNGNTESIDSGIIKIPLKDITDRITKLEYDAEGTKVRYFVVRAKDGNIRTAFDACDVCGGKLGYTQRGNDVVCNKCGRAFRIDDLGTKNRGGGCWPGYLSHTIEGDSIIIKKSELEQGAHRFR